MVKFKWTTIRCFLFKGCTPAVATISRMAASWSVPHLSYAGMDESLGNKNEFSLLTRMSFTLNAFAKFYVEVNNYIYHCHGFIQTYHFAYVPLYIIHF